MTAKIVILVCAVATADCSEQTAIRVVRAELPCFMAEAYIAQTELRPQPGEYLKIVCHLG
jgi:hypothetical protein